jgi:hypothetical protein
VDLEVTLPIIVEKTDISQNKDIVIDAHTRGSCYKHEKPPIIVSPYAVVEPLAVVVEMVDTPVTLRAVL